MQIQFLGTSAGLPSRFRNVSSTALKLLEEMNEIWLFDCGEGTQSQILQTTIKPAKISKIFVTHLHGDHIFGLPGLLSSRSFQGGENTVLDIIGPEGIREFITSALSLSRTHLSYRLNFTELSQSEGMIKEKHGYNIHYHKLDHNITSYGFRVEEPPASGKLLMSKVEALGITPGPILGRLKNKETVTLTDGRVIHGRELLGPDRPGRIVTILGDTRPCLGTEILAKNASVLVHEGTYGPEAKALAHKHYHSTVVDACQLAKRSQVEQLYINHISPRYLGEKIQHLITASRKIFPKSYLVKDFDSFDILAKK